MVWHISLAYVQAICSHLWLAYIIWLSDKGKCTMKYTCSTSTNMHIHVYMYVHTHTHTQHFSKFFDTNTKVLAKTNSIALSNMMIKCIVYTEEVRWAHCGLLRWFAHLGWYCVAERTKLSRKLSGLRTKGLWVSHAWLWEYSFEVWKLLKTTFEVGKQYILYMIAFIFL